MLVYGTNGANELGLVEVWVGRSGAGMLRAGRPRSWSRPNAAHCFLSSASLYWTSRGWRIKSCGVPRTFWHLRDRIELEQIIEQTFKDNPMLKAQMMKSAAEEWYEEGLVKGREEGREEGMLIGQIRTLQQVFNLAVTPEMELKTLALEQLQTRLNQVQAAHRRAPNS